MAWSFPAPTGTPTTWLTSLVASLRGILNNFPGGSIQPGTVARDRLAKPGAEATAALFLGNLAATSIANLAQVGGPVSDGGAVTRRVTFVSLTFDALTLAKVATCAIKLYVGATFGTKGAAILTIDLNSGSLVAGEPYLVTAGFDWAAGQNIYVDYTGAALAVYDDANMLMFYEAPHVDPTT